MRRASLNHIYRLVWSEREQAFIAVAENVRTKGKSSGICRSLAALVGIGLSAFSYADGVVVAPGSGATNVYTAPNGVPVVDIDKANAAGLSHNKYLNYNVGTNGLILNNANSSQMSRQSQLAGQVMANTNLSAEAKVILNEVVTTNRSTLQGYTEVVGGKADVILANPYGITCNGCGFINTDRVTLTTGTPNISNTGALSGFTINGGDIFIDGAGLDGMKQSYFDIVTRTFRMNAQLNGKDVKIITGTNQWDYLTQTASAITPTGTAPTFAFDSSLLGGMYSNRIFIQATEAGVGVKMLGEAATTADDFTISAAGKIDIRSKVSAERNLALTSTSNATDAIGLTDANLSAKNNLILTANNGGATLNGGLLVASNDLTGALGSLTDNANATAVTDNNKRYAKGNVSLTVTNAATIDGTNWGSAAASDYNVGSLNIGAAGATLYADTSLGITANSGNLALATAAIKATDNLTLTSTNGSISTTAGAGQGIQTTAGKLAVTSGSDFSNAGVISADTGSVTVRTNGTVTNSGTLHAATTMDIADKNNAATENVSNTGTLLVDGTLSAKANNFSNAGSLQGTAGVNLSAANLTNSGTFIASNTAGKSGTFSNLTTLDNSGTLQSAEDLTLNVSGTVTNSGKLLATHDLAVLAGTSALDISNTATGILQANNALNITGSNATLDRQLGTILGNNEVNLTLANFDNRGTLQSNASIHYAMANRFSNAGTVLAKTTLTGSSVDLTNSGTLQANQGATITATNAISNTGSLIVSSGAAYAGTLTAATLSNSGAGNIQSAHDLTINLTGDSLVNESKILADDDLTISATGTAVINNRTDGFIQAGTGAGDDLTITGNALTLNNNIGATLLGDRLAFTALDVSNDGTVQGGAGASSVTITNTLTNKGLFSLANATGGSGSITADSILNYETLQSAGAVNLNIASQLTNNNRLLADGALTIRGTDSSYSVTNAKTLQAGGVLDIKGQSNGSGVSITVDNSGVMLGNSMDVNADTLTVNEGGMVSSIAAMTLGLNTLSFGGSTSRIVGSTDGSSTTAITLANSFTNPGAVAA